MTLQRLQVQFGLWMAIIGALASCLFLCDLPSYGSETSSPLRLRPVKVMRLNLDFTRRDLSLPGISKASREAALSFRVSGPLQELPVRIGQHVSQGEIIARLDQRDYRLQIRRLQAAIDEAASRLEAMRRGARQEDIQALKARINAAKAKETEATLMYQRYENLYREKAVARAVIDNARSSFEAAAAQVEALSQELEKALTGARREDIDAMESRIAGLNAQLKEATNALEDTVLTAPFPGYIAQKLIENYETIRAGQPIVVLLDVSSIDVTAGISEDLVVQESDFHDFICEFDAYPGKRFPASVKEIGKAPNPVTRTYPLTVTIETGNTTPAIRPGMAATITFSIPVSQTASPRFVLPAEAIVNTPDGNSFVWIYSPETSCVTKRPVMTAGIRSEGIEITGGLDPDDWVVIAGASFLRADERVRPVMSGTGSEGGQQP